MEQRAIYNDYIVRVPQGGDVSRLSSLSQSMGWVVISLSKERAKENTQKFKGLASLRGILATDDDTSYDEMRRKALSEKYGLEL